MADLVPVTEESLRAAMRDPRYWRSGHPEREAYGRWVTEGWEAVAGADAAQGAVVHVRAYTRTRNGKTEHVAAHTRSDPPGGDGEKMSSARTLRNGRTDGDAIQLAAAPALVQGAIRLAPLIGRVLPRALPALRRRNLLEDAIEGARRGSIGPRSWYNAIPEQPGEREAAGEVDQGTRGAGSERPPASEPRQDDGERPRYTIDSGQQSKHLPGHGNHRPGGGRSELDPSVDPQSLVDRHAHRGTSANGMPAGQPGARERFDNGDEIIAIYRDGRGASAPTTRGMIHYGAGGRVHVVPARPRGWIEGGR